MRKNPFDAPESGHFCPRFPEVSAGSVGHERPAENHVQQDTHMTITAERIPIKNRGRYVTVASILFFLTGIPLPIFVSYTALYVLENQQLPIIFGIRAFGGGFIEGLGPDALVAFGLVFAFVGALELLVGYWLWGSLKKGGQLAVILFPMSMFFWVGFLLPGPMLIGPLRLLLIASEWKTLR